MSGTRPLLTNNEITVAYSAGTDKSYYLPFFDCPPPWSACFPPARTPFPRPDDAYTLFQPYARVETSPPLVRPRGVWDRLTHVYYLTFRPSRCSAYIFGPSLSGVVPTNSTVVVLVHRSELPFFFYLGPFPLRLPRAPALPLTFFAFFS